MDDHVSRLIDLVPKDGSTFDIQRLFFLLTIDSATHFLFGESVGSLRAGTDTGLLGKSAVGNAEGFAEAFNTAQEYLAARSRAVIFYWMINPKEFRDANKRVHEVVDHYVQLALESRRNSEKQPGGRYIFAEALAAENDDPKVLRDNMLNILLAGRDTTASLLSSTFFYLARHPNVWTKLRQAILDAFGDAEHPKEEITQTKLKDIPYLRYVLNEGMSPPTQCTVERSLQPTSPSAPATRPCQLPRRQQGHNLTCWRWTGSKVPRLRPQGHSSHLQCIRHAPPDRLLWSGR
jgi:cytochrome P450